MAKIKIEELWALDITICNFIIPRLKAFAKHSVGSYPYSLENGKEWKKIIKKMLKAFKLVRKSGNGQLITDKQEKEIKEGLELFAEYFQNLWI